MRQFPLVLIAAAMLVFSGCGQQKTNSETTDAASGAKPAEFLSSSSAPVASTTSVDFSRLKGRWERPDGGYVLEIRDIAADGKADAGYFNPSPIKVESAQVSSDSGVFKVFVILRDVNYPGCTYTLAYDSQTDQLVGKYYQATAQQTYDIAFARLK